MHLIIKTIDEIIGYEQRDMLFITFNFLEDTTAWRERHFEWFIAKDLRYEMAAPKGWLGGDSGIFVVYFKGVDDPRVAEYARTFEHDDGTSLEPNEYQMTILPYETWQKDGARL